MTKVRKHVGGEGKSEELTNDREILLKARLNDGRGFLRSHQEGSGPLKGVGVMGELGLDIPRADDSDPDVVWLHEAPQSSTVVKERGLAGTVRGGPWEIEESRN